jgi:hypothetical protein
MYVNEIQLFCDCGRQIMVSFSFPCKSVSVIFFLYINLENIFFNICNKCSEKIISGKGHIKANWHFSSSAIMANILTHAVAFIFILCFNRSLTFLF